jgi:hypothetical protein
MQAHQANDSLLAMKTAPRSDHEAEHIAVAHDLGCRIYRATTEPTENYVDV